MAPGSVDVLPHLSYRLHGSPEFAKTRLMQSPRSAESSLIGASRIIPDPQTSTPPLVTPSRGLL